MDTTMDTWESGTTKDSTAMDRGLGDFTINTKIHFMEISTMCFQGVEAQFNQCSNLVLWYP